jgi:hypothetical protein
VASQSSSNSRESLCRSRPLRARTGRASTAGRRPSRRRAAAGGVTRVREARGVHASSFGWMRACPRPSGSARSRRVAALRATCRVTTPARRSGIIAPSAEQVSRRTRSNVLRFAKSRTSAACAASGHFPPRGRGGERTRSASGLVEYRYGVAFHVNGREPPPRVRLSPSDPRSVENLPVCRAFKYRHGDSNPGFRRERAAS